MPAGKYTAKHAGMKIARRRLYVAVGDYTKAWRCGMSASEKLTFSLRVEEARYIDALVESGAYSSASEVVRAGLRALQERDTSIDQWLRQEVVPVYDAMQRDPGRALSGEHLISDLRAHHVKRLKNQQRDA